MEDKIFDIVTDLIRDDISKNEAIDKLLILYSVSKCNLRYEFTLCSSSLHRRLSVTK